MGLLARSGSRKTGSSTPPPGLLARSGSRKIGLSTPPQYFNTDSSKAVLLLWFLTVTCSCCPYLYFGSPVMLVTYFSKF